MLVLHANWIDGALHLWGEGLDAYHRARAGHSSVAVAPSHASAGTVATDSALHSFALAAQDLRTALNRCGIQGAIDALNDGVLRLRLPRDADGPWPSERLGRAAGTVEHVVDPWLGDFNIPCLVVPAGSALHVLASLGEDHPGHGIELSQSLRYWNEVAMFVIDLLADQRFIPALGQPHNGDGLTASWQPWLVDEQARARVSALLAAMPPVVRAAGDHHESPWTILVEAIRLMTDSFVREVLHADAFIEAIADRDASADSHVMWLSGLLGQESGIGAKAEHSFDLVREIEQWIGRLDDTGQGRPFHLCLRLNEPAQALAPEVKPPATQDVVWTLSLHLQSAEDESVLIDAAALWGRDAGSGQFNGHRVDHPQELLLSELARASRVYPKIEEALGERAPHAINLTTAEAYEFLREIKPVLEEAGVGVIPPSWWDQPMGRLAARLQVEPLPDSSSPQRTSADGTSTPVSVLGLNTLVQFRWQVAVGDQPLTVEEFKSLVKVNEPLVQVRGRWMEISPEQLLAARNLLAANPSGQMTLLQAIHLSHGTQSRQLGVPVTGMDASGWIADVLGASSDPQKMLRLEQPASFVGTLRPYQGSGLSWLAFLDQHGLGACLADDMGLGKTIQLIALLLHERIGASVPVGPTLLIVPTSVVSNWSRELARFAPSLKVHVHHGPDRAAGQAFESNAYKQDVIITTYPLVARDAPTLQSVKWHRVALDEAQYIKNPPTKQTMAIRGLHAPRRLALTGTPVENRLSELWSIMDFCNPGYLGPAADFRRRFALAIERRRDLQHAEQLKRLVRPFILRRVKTDPNVINDLPPCLETKEYATLTAEQASLYQSVVNSMLSEINRAEGMQRRGLVLSALVRLKQICNHPAQWNPRNSPKSRSTGNTENTEQATDDAPVPVIGDASLTTLSHRSGKTQRLLTMLEEVRAAGGKALIFTQFRQMGHLLTAMIQHELDCEALFLHGGTPANKRQHLIDRFQDQNSDVPFFVLSLKAGGLGLNLTAANHVFHFDRWWNPAVENQATDRAFRIGQTRTVHVHKFVCVGTLEERIDQMIESKMELATNIIGSGEQWLTELSTTQLHELLTLRQSAVEAES